MVRAATKPRKRSSGPEVRTRAGAGGNGSATAVGTRRGTRVDPVVVTKDGRGTRMVLGDGYEVVSGDRTRRKRTYTIRDADQHLEPRSLGQLRELGRDLDRNSSLIHGVVERFVDNTIGPTFGFRPKTEDPGWNQAAHEWMVEQQGLGCESRGLFDWHEILRLSMRNLMTDGDSVLIHLSDRKLQAVEAHEIATPLDAKRRGKKVVNGVEVNKAGRPLAFWISPKQRNGYFGRMADGRRVPVEETVWPAYRTRFTQTRGTPILTSAFKHYDRLDGYIDAESLAAEIDACLAFFIRSPTDYLGDSTIQPGQEADTHEDGTSKIIEKIEPGMIARVQSDEEIQAFGAKRPGGQFDPYVVTSLRILGAAIGMPLELVLLDFSRTNYSSARAALQQAYRVFRCWQNWAIRTICTPIYRRWIAMGIAAGELTMRADAMKVMWFPPRWAWIDPLKEVLALKEAVGLGIETLTSEIERRGQTVEEYRDERAAEIKTYGEAGIPSSGMAAATVSGSVDPYKVALANEDE